jgi:Txe/YoeB family toxin of Txe-Axe toxin-antitoxin module
MNKQARVILLDEADSEYKRLSKIVEMQADKENSEEMQLLRSINQKIEFLRLNPFYGDGIHKSLIPKDYLLRYKIKNLWRAELVHHWRMLYTVKGDQVDIICFVLEITDHKTYDKIFGYKKR